MIAAASEKSVQYKPYVPPFPPALLWSALGLFALLATASLFLAGPQIQVDEGSYLLTAATIAGKLVVNGVYGYYSGYSLLLVPAFLFGSDPDRIYHIALVMNALFVATTPLALFRLTNVLQPKLGKGTHTAVALAATCYAPLLLISQHTMSEGALVPLYAWLLATGANGLVTQRVTHAFCCGLIAGMLLLVHPRGAAIAVPVLATFGIFGLRDPAGRRVILAIAMVAIGVALLHAPIEHLANKDASIGSSYSATKVFGRLTEPVTWFWITLNLLGSATEAIVTSLGIFAVAICVIAVDLYRTLIARKRPITAQTVVTVAIVLGAGAALFMSAIFFVPPQRADHIAYGRYALPAVVPMLAVGLLRLSLPSTKRLRDFAAAMALALVCIALMGYAFTRLPLALTVRWNYINAPCLYLAQQFVHFRNPWWAIGLCFLVFGIALAMCAVRSARAGMGMFTLLNISIAALAWGHFVLPQSRIIAREQRIDVAADAFENSTNARLCLWMSSQLDLWQAIDLRWRIFPKIAPLVPGNDDLCVRGVIDPIAGAGPTRSGLRLIELERSPVDDATIAGLFVEPGPALDKWEQTHRTPALESFAPLPPTEWHADIELSDSTAIPEYIPAGSTLNIRVTVRHDGVDSRWTPVQYGPYRISLGARVTLGANDQAIGEYRVSFPEELDPGQSRPATVMIGPFKDPGVYHARIGVLQEKVAWFSGAQDIKFEVVEP